MGKEYECCGQIIEVLRGEAINNRNTGMLLYAAMCRCNRNLLYVVREMLPDRIGEDHVNDVLSHLYDIPQQYAMDCLAGYGRQQESHPHGYFLGDEPNIFPHGNQDGNGHHRN